MAPADLLTNSLRASRTFPEPVSSKICTVYPLEGLRPPTVALGVLVLSITSCSESPTVGMGAGEAAKVGGCMHVRACVSVCLCVCMCAHVHVRAWLCMCGREAKAVAGF